MAGGTATFRVVLSSTIPMSGGITQVEGSGPIVGDLLNSSLWRMDLQVEAPPADPWPNTPEGGHEVHGGTMALYKDNELVRSWSNCEYHVWRNSNNEPRRIYAENENPGSGEAWSIGGPVPDTDNVEYDNDHEEWVFTCHFEAAENVIPDE